MLSKTRKKWLILFLLLVILQILIFYTLNSEKSELNSRQFFKDLEVKPSEASQIIFGSSYIKVPINATVVVQVDRVIRDKSSKYNLNVSPDHKPTSYKEIVPWMEGSKVGELMNYSNINVIPATNVTVKKLKNGYFGPDDKGNFIFNIDPSKVDSVHAVKLGDDTYSVIDTHGMSLMVPEAVKQNASLVIACGDLEGKAKAEEYMGKLGINCYAPCDRLSSIIMPYNGSGVILGGAPIRKTNESGSIIGAQPIVINKNEKIIVQTTTKTYPDGYCDTPFRYFSNLKKAFNISLNIDIVDASVGEAGKVVDKAYKTNANVIGVRVLSDKDKKPVEEWLKKDENHKALLFHSAPYDPGYSLFFEFPYQVTGQDIEPKFIKNTEKKELEMKFNTIRKLWQ